MSVSLSPAARGAIVTTLRAAGCVFAEDEADLLIDAAGTPDAIDATAEEGPLTIIGQTVTGK
jgi:release factor glutamine methyltransferase